jgi:S1-C subfamily serine protease
MDDEPTPENPERGNQDQHESPEWSTREHHTPASRRRRVAAMVVVSAVVVGGTGVGLVAMQHLRSTPTSQSLANASTRGYGGMNDFPESSGSYGSFPSRGGFTAPDGGPPGGWAGQPGSPSGPSWSTREGHDIADATDAESTGLARIVASLSYEGGTAVGTGMVLTPVGEIVTIHHVVEGATSIKVTVVSTGRTYTARVVGTDAKDDIAVLQLQNATGLATVTPDTGGVSVGDAVTAVGDANGDSSSLTASSGTVTALLQSITTQSEQSATSEHLKGLIEIAADVVSGDSGGATLDADGEVVGMTTAASTGSADVTGYAVPIAKVLRIADEIEAGVHSARISLGYDGFLGVELAPSRSAATLVGVLADSPASRAGLAAGDKITSVGGVHVSSAGQLRQTISSYDVGDSLTVIWIDSTGSRQSATISLEEAPGA